MSKYNQYFAPYVDDATFQGLKTATLPIVRKGGSDGPASTDPELNQYFLIAQEMVNDDTVRPFNVKYTVKDLETTHVLGEITLIGCTYNMTHTILYSNMYYTEYNDCFEFKPGVLRNYIGVYPKFSKDKNRISLIDSGYGYGNSMFTSYSQEDFQEIDLSTTLGALQTHKHTMADITDLELPEIDTSNLATKEELAGKADADHTHEFDHITIADSETKFSDWTSMRFRIMNQKNVGISITYDKIWRSNGVIMDDAVIWASEYNAKIAELEARLAALEGK